MTDNRRVRAALMLLPLIATGCDRLFALTEVADTDGAATDATVLDGPTGDTTALGEWGPASRVTPFDLLPTDADDPSFTSDRLQLFFEANGDIMVRTRASTSSAWDAAIRVNALSSASDDTTPNISPDGKTMYLASTRLNGNEDLFVATRSSATGAWTMPVVIAGLSTVDDDSGATVTPDDLLMIFSRSQNNDDLWQATRESTSEPWLDATTLGELNTAAKEAGATVFDDGRGLIFVSDRAGTDDLYITTRPTPTGTFSAPTVITELSTAEDEEDPFVSADGRTLYFIRDGVLMMSTR